MFRLCHFYPSGRKPQSCSQNSPPELFQAFDSPLPSRLKWQRGGEARSLTGNVAQMEGEGRCWYTCVSNMYLHDCVRLASVEGIAPDAKGADGGARVRRLGFRGLATVT